MSIDQTLQKWQMTDSICDCLSRMRDIIYMSSPRIDEELPGVACLAVAKQLTSQWEASDYHGLQGTHGNRTKRLGITDPKELAKKLIALPPGSIGYVYKIWSVNFTSVEDLAVELKGTHVQLVDHRALKGLIVQKEAALGRVE